MGQVLKQTIFVNGLIHNSEQKILLVRRSSSDKFLPGYLELPGGRVEIGESLEDALRRKLSRELGVKTDHPMYYSSLAHIEEDGPYVRVVFEIAYDNTQVIKLTSNHDEFIWVDKNQSLETKLASDARKVIDQYLGSVNKNENIDENLTTLIVNTDGGSRGNPGPSASAFVIRNNHGSVIESDGEYIGITTNSMAEYTAVSLALKAVKNITDCNANLIFKIDSLMVVNQLNGIYKVKNRELWPINQEIRELVKNFSSVRFNHIPREENIAADGKVNQILDNHNK